MTPGSLPANPASPLDGILQPLLAVSLTGVCIVRPLYSPGGALEDFALDYFNPAAQRMTGLPERPAGTLRSLFPHTLTLGIFAFYQRVFDTGQPDTFEANYQADGLDNYFRIAAQRHQDRLVVSFTDTADQSRTAVEMALREAQARTEQQRTQLEALFMQAPAALCRLDGPDLVYALVNPVYQQLFPGRQLLGLPLLAALPELRGHAVCDALQQVYRTGQTHVDQRVRIPLARTPGGPLVDFYLNYIFQPDFDATGRPRGVLVYAFDVTQEALASQQLQQLNQELEGRVSERTNAALAFQADVLAAAQRQVRERQAFHAVFEQAPALIALLRSPSHRFEYVNPAYQQLFPGRPLVGLDMVAAVPEAQEQGFVALLDRVYQTGETFFGAELPFAPMPAAGPPLSPRYYNFTYQAYRENDQIAGVTVFAFDVNGQVLARQQRDTERQQLQDLFEQAPVAIGIVRGADYVLEVANPLIAQLWGRTPAEVLGRPVFEALPEARDQGFKELLDGVRQSGEAFVAEGVAAQLLRGDAPETVYLNYVYQPLRDADGTITRVAAVGTDVTSQVQDRQRVQELNDQLAAINGQLEASNTKLEASNDQLTRTNADLDNFIYTASHDLKAPISNIEGLLYLLQKELPAAAVQGTTVGPTLAHMLEAVERFKRTINHLTEVSKLQKEHAPVADSVNLAAVVEDVSQDLRPLLQETGATLVVAVAATPPIHFAEKNLRSIVYNLLSNAVKYRSPDRPPRVDVRGHVRAGHTVLEVHDNGLGLAPAHLPKLFTMFQRFHDHVEGTGIGLYMVKRMVENAGGRIEVQSQLGVGTTFFVYLPHTPLA
jgi:PAS domain S-box-containing protein